MGLYWEFANRTPSGVTGITGAQRVICDSEIDRISENIIRALSNSQTALLVLIIPWVMMVNLI